MSDFFVVSDPTHYGEAAEKEEWRTTVLEEIKCIERTDTWEMMQLPEGKKSNWLEMGIQDKICNSSIEKNKTRVLKKGYVQQYDINIEETFSGNSI